MKRGRFVVFEGLDGAGSTTQCERLASWLQSRSLPVEVTREPTTGPFGSVVRQALEGRLRLDNLTLGLAFAADRSDHVNQPDHGIRSLLRRGFWVLCDRYVLSSLAYQSEAEKDIDWLLSINAGAVKPDLTVFVDTTPSTCIERIATRSSKFEMFHDETELGRVVRNYQRLVSRTDLIGRLIVVDGNRSADAVGDEVRAGVEGYFAEVLSSGGKAASGASAPQRESDVTR